MSEIKSLGFTTCWGDNPDPTQIRTTCTARTSLQPQLNKAVRHVDIAQKSDMNPKDMIVYYAEQMSVVPSENMGKGRQANPVKDNTGVLRYKEATVFPTLRFPSDHGIVGVALKVGSPRAAWPPPAEKPSRGVSGFFSPRSS
mmetsp:Transcript_25892/g.71246  ORF Transcript_25892/g.71246 Transcript_25892/m.71246 type:complete len:142 (-) Transcript_25892:56-481(-)